ncbi:hypothetical protein C8Q75DRAFT_737919 [Abortiporus biennis]|nr:hypothetical protein C8Q75DRAFT_737919 [Abortiporus biennis]
MTGCELDPHSGHPSSGWQITNFPSLSASRIDCNVTIPRLVWNLSLISSASSLHPPLTGHRWRNKQKFTLAHTAAASERKRVRFSEDIVECTTYGRDDYDRQPKVSRSTKLGGSIKSYIRLFKRERTNVGKAGTLTPLISRPHPLRPARDARRATPGVGVRYVARRTNMFL